MRSFLEVYYLATGQTRLVLATETLIEAPNWHAEGWLLVNSAGRLFRVPLDAPALHPIDTGFAQRCNNDHGISPDGRFIMFSSHTERGAEIFVVPVTGGPAKAVTQAAPSWFHGWSPDGRQIVYAAAREGRMVDICTCPAAGGPERRLTQGQGHSDGPEFSADGEWIYYNCDRSGHAQIWRMRADGSVQAQLFADDHVNWFPHPSPDGRFVLYLAYPPGTEGHPRDRDVALVLMNPDGGNRRRVAAFNGGQGTINGPCWAPDGSAFAFVRYGLTKE